ncbi:MAG: hypothetical protein EXR72_03015 [Myxococcales bacterium]|nr:hypothetical protein [Myxococcales bacterium]
MRVNRPELIDSIRAVLPPGAREIESPIVDRLYSVVGGGAPRPGVRAYHLVYADALRLTRTLDFANVLNVLDGDARLFVASLARRRIFVHAGVVAWNGQAIVIPGSSRSGKSSLVAALVRAGATYYSDEYAVFDERGRVHPYARPLGLRTEGSDVAHRHPVEELGGVAGSAALPVGLVIATGYRAGTSWRPRRLTAGQATLALLAHTVPARRAAARALATLGEVAIAATGLRGARGEAGEAAQAILRRLEARNDSDMNADRLLGDRHDDRVRAPEVR